jgi:hypothetical protein
MVTLTHIRVMVTLLVAMGIALSMTSCGEVDTSGVQNTVTVSYTLPIIPITLSFDTNGHIKISASANIITELGEVSVSVGVGPTTYSVPDASLLLTIRHKQDGNLVDTSYQISTGGAGSADVQGNINEVKVGWNGKSNSVFIDASNGDITSIVVQGAATSYTTPVAATVVPTDTPTPTPTATPTPKPTPTATPIPTPTPTTGSTSPAPEPRPQSAQEIANKLGGDPNDWTPYGSNGWVYRGGPEANSFTVPHWCVVDTPQGRFYPGDQVQPQVALTIYYNVSRYDLAGHNP